MSLPHWFRRPSFNALLLFACLAATSAQGVTPLPVLADPNLQNCLVEQASRNGWIFAEQVTQLNCARRGVVILAGMELLVNLSELDLSNNALDILPLFQLRTLTKFNVSGNRALTLQQVQPVLSQNVNLTSIGLNGIAIGEFSNLPLFNPLLNRPYDLTELDLGNTALTNVGTKNLEFARQFPNLSKLNVAGNGINDIFGLNNALKLTELDLSNNALDILPLFQLRTLTKFNVSGNRALTLQQVQPVLSQNVNLTSIGLNGIAIGEFSNLPLFNPLLNRPYDLTELDLGNTALTNVGTKNLEFARQFPNLSKLNVAGNGINDIFGLNNALKLTELDLSNNALVNILPLTNLRAARTINLLDNNQIRCADLDAVAIALALAKIQRPISCVTNNLPPVASATGPTTVAEGSPVILSGAGNDPDGSIVAFAWQQTSGPGVVLVNAGTASPSFTAPAVTSNTPLTFQLTVTDNQGATGSTAITVTVSNVNQLPTVSAGANQSINEGAAITLRGSATDPDGAITTYQWMQTAGPAVTLTGAATAQASFTAPLVFTDTVLTFQLTVADNDGALAVATINVGVKNVNGVDLIVTTVSGSVTTIKRGSSFTFTTTTKNAGDQGTNTSNTTGLYLSRDSNITTTDTRIGAVGIVSLGAGASVRANRTVIVPSTLTPGTYYLGAIADYTRRQIELNEANNSLVGLTILVTQ